MKSQDTSHKTQEERQQSGTTGGWIAYYLKNKPGPADAAMREAAPEMFAVLAGICMEKSAHICGDAPESCAECPIRAAILKARGE